MQLWNLPGATITARLSPLLAVKPSTGQPAAGAAREPKGILRHLTVQVHPGPGFQPQPFGPLNF